MPGGPFFIRGLARHLQQSGASPEGEAPPRRASACTPDSVRAAESTRRPVPPSIWDRRHRRPRAAYPSRDTRGQRAAPPERSAGLCGLAPRGVCLAATVAGRAGGLLPHRFTHHLCGRGRPPSAGLFSVAHAVAPLARDAFPLGSTVPCGVRTFLPGTRPKALPRRRPGRRVHKKRAGAGDRTDARSEILCVRA